MADLIKPDELRKATLAKEVERARQIADADKRRDEERSHLQEAFMNGKFSPTVRLGYGLPSCMRRSAMSLSTTILTSKTMLAKMAAKREVGYRSLGYRTVSSAANETADLLA